MTKLSNATKQRLWAYLAAHPDQTTREIATALKLGPHDLAIVLNRGIHDGKCHVSGERDDAKGIGRATWRCGPAKQQKAAAV